MRAKKLSRVVGFAFVVAGMGGIGATAWAGTDESAPTPPSTVVESPSPAAPPAQTGLKPESDFGWG